ncbi:MAG: alkaline phosphatase family protein [Gammaproteobacteria bacterium]
MPQSPLAVINIVGLTPALLGEHTPHLNALVADGFMAPAEGVFPAVTCTAQASMLTGTLPREHGIVANGWYFRELSEVLLWRQINALMQGDKVWEAARRAHPGHTTAQLFWWYNQYADVQWSVTPKPIYPADGRKIPGLYSSPKGFHEGLEKDLGAFPFFDFWGPKSGLPSSDWIAHCGQRVFAEQRPDLTFIYLPHLDYNLQRLGPRDPATWQDVAAIDAVAGRLIDDLRGQGADILVVSEYGIEQATGVVNINQHLRAEGWLAARDTLGWELLDFGASRAFAMADHQVAHVYIKDPADIPRVKRSLEGLDGIERVLDEDGKRELGLDHARSGELVAMAAPGHWFTYYYWLDHAKAPDFAPTVDIHRKPGYDPCELFIDPDLRFPKLRIIKRLIQKKLGMRMLMDVIPIKPGLVKGTHGRPAEGDEDGPLIIGSRRDLARDRLALTDVKSLILAHR